MKRSLHFRLEGHEPVPVEGVLEWARAFGDAESRRVAWDEPCPGVTVSTVFLGIDHNFRETGPPLLFETMTFVDEDGVEQIRTSTWDEAAAAHQAETARVAALGAEAKARLQAALHE